MRILQSIVQVCFVSIQHLNHHPLVPEGMNTKLWLGRRFDLANPELFLRVERQVIHGFPSINTFLFGDAITYSASINLFRYPDESKSLP